MKKYTKKILSRVQEHQIKKKLDETSDFEKIQDHLEEIGLRDFVHRKDEK